MARPAKKKSSPKKAAKKPAPRKAAAKPAPVAKSSSRVSGGNQPGQPAATPYTPKAIEGVGWPAFRYPLQ
jgi:hypothetical protein